MKLSLRKIPDMKRSLRYESQTLILRRHIRLSHRILPVSMQSLHRFNRSYRLNHLKSFLISWRALSVTGLTGVTKQWNFHARTFSTGRSHGQIRPKKFFFWLFHAEPTRECFSRRKINFFEKNFFEIFMKFFFLNFLKFLKESRF